MENKRQLNVRTRRVLEELLCPRITKVEWGQYTLRRSYLGKQDVVLDPGEQMVGYCLHHLISLRKSGFVTIANPPTEDQYALVQFVM